MNYTQEIANKKKGVADLIRDYSKSQKDLWQKIPYLALKAVSCIGLCPPDQLKNAYRYGIWRITDLRGFPTLLTVDCATGELVSEKNNALFVKTPDEFVLSVIIENLDAQKIIDDLNAKVLNKKVITDVNNELGFLIYIGKRWREFSAKTPEEWVNKVAKLCSVKETYSRKVKFKAIV